MLWYQGFQNDGKLFYLGYASADFQIVHSSNYMFKILFKPSWKVLHNGHICYIGKNGQSYFPVSMHPLPEKKYKGREYQYHRGVTYCFISECQDKENDLRNRIVDESNETSADRTKTECRM